MHIFGTGGYQRDVVVVVHMVVYRKASSYGHQDTPFIFEFQVLLPGLISEQRGRPTKFIRTGDYNGNGKTTGWKWPFGVLCS